MPFDGPIAGCAHLRGRVQAKEQTLIEMNEAVSKLRFGLKYLVNFGKAASLSEVVVLTLTQQLPLQVGARWQRPCWLSPRASCPVNGTLWAEHR